MVIEYLTDYRTQLRELVKTPADLFEPLIYWQLRTAMVASQAQAALNAMFFPTPHNPSRLIGHHPLTTAVGGLEGIVVIAANPGYSADGNVEELAFRATPGGNIDFCRSFFDAAADITKNIQWWRSVVKFAHKAATGEEVDDVNQLWAWANDSGLVGSVDLIPFHSSNDGITGLIESSQPQHDREMRDALRLTASEALKMVLRLRPKVVIIVSDAGRHLADEILGGEYEEFTCTVTNQWGDQFQYKIRHIESNGTHIVMRPGQLFSRQAGMGALQNSFAEKIFEMQWLR
jgi:hypothetical protein